jgi:beta-phosphoglucomutase
MPGKVSKRKRASLEACAAIFDMDGVIVDNMRHHAKAWEAFLRRRAPDLRIEAVMPHFGKTNRDILRLVLGDRAGPEEVALWGEEKEGLYREIYAAEMTPLPGLLHLLKTLRKRGIRTIVATSAPGINVDFVLDGLKIRPWFDAVVDASEVKAGKPDPEIYLQAARKAACLPEACVVFEDSLAGIEAGLRAGMKVVGVATTLPAEKLRGAEMVIRDFREITLSRAEGPAVRPAGAAPQRRARATAPRKRRIS